jgi:hypothetical protein
MKILKWIYEKRIGLAGFNRLKMETSDGLL